jgi:hypothetical protein
MDTNLSLMDTSVIEFQKGISFGKKSGSIIEVTKRAVEPDAIAPRSTAANKWAVWGSDNNRAQKIIDENMQDGASAGALRFKIWAHYGAGIQFHKLRIEKDREIIEPVRLEDLPAEMEDFFFINDLENLQQSIISDFEWWSFYYLQYIPNKSKNKILKVNWQRAKDVRAGLRDINDGAIKSYFLSADWPHPITGKFAQAPAFDKFNPFGKSNAIYRHGLPSIDKDYYPTPYWQSNLKWLAVAQKIPEWINANIENSVNIKYHIIIPEEYFIALYPEENYDSKQECQEARIEAEETLKISMDDLLSGQKNVSKTFYSKIAVDENGEKLPGWEIHPISNDVKDGAWLNAYGTASAAQGTAHGVNPSLMGLILSNGLGTGSSSDVREQFNYYLQLNTVIPRQTTLEWFNLVKRYNKWPRDIHMGYKNIILQTMDQNKSGYAIQNEAKPTTAKE